jgi:hypothetical protein
MADSADSSPDADSFAVTDRNRLRRKHQRGSYDKAAVYAVLDAGLLCHVAYVIDGQPFCTPTLHWRDGDTLYWHGSSAGRMLRHLAAGTPACLTVSHVDGLVLARSGFNHSLNFRSAMCFGTARNVEDPADKARALTALIDRFYPDRAATLRPTTPQEVKATTVIAMPIDQASAKVRRAGVGDDEADYDLPVWAAVIPVRTLIGADQPCPRLRPDVTRPPGLSPYREGRSLDEALTEAQRRYEAR